MCSYCCSWYMCYFWTWKDQTRQNQPHFICKRFPKESPLFKQKFKLFLKISQLYQFSSMIKTKTQPLFHLTHLLQVSILTLVQKAFESLNYLLVNDSYWIVLSKKTSIKQLPPGSNLCVKKIKKDEPLKVFRELNASFAQFGPIVSIKIHID